MKNLYFSILFLLKFSLVSAQFTVPGTPLSTVHSLDFEDVPVIELPSFNNDSLIERYHHCEYETGCRKPFGMTLPVDVSLNNAGETIIHESGKVIRLRVRSQNSYGFKFTFTGFEFPAGTTLFIYDPGKTRVYGAYSFVNNNEDRRLSTGIIMFNDVIIELNHGGSLENIPTLFLNNFTYIYLNRFQFNESRGDECHINVNCPPWVGDWCNEIRATLRYDSKFLASDGTIKDDMCSGVLLNNTNNDLEPYILTASHCLIDGVNMNDWIIYFNWQSPDCLPSSMGNDELREQGISIVADSGIEENGCPDIALLKMNTKPRVNYNVFYAGWNRGAIPSNIGTGFHHPEGDVKKVISGVIRDEGILNCLTLDATDGYVEYGSSGSPLFDSERRVIASLLGIEDGHQTCDEFWLVYTTLNQSWNLLNPFLAPENEEAVQIDGIDPIGICQQDVEVYGNLYPGNDWQAKNQITIQAANNIVAAPNGIRTEILVTPTYVGVIRYSDYVFRAGNEVSLLPGFHAQQGNNFHAYIGDCEDFEGCGFNYQAKRSVTSTKNTEKEVAKKQVSNLSAFPNPFSGVIDVTFDLIEPANARLNLYDINGRLIRTLVKGDFSEGKNTIRSIDISYLPAGVYIISLNMSNETRRMKIVKY